GSARRLLPRAVSRGKFSSERFLHVLVSPEDIHYQPGLLRLLLPVPVGGLDLFVSLDLLLTGKLLPDARIVEIGNLASQAGGAAAPRPRHPRADHRVEHI